MDSNVLELTPPLTIEAGRLDEGVRRLSEAIRTADRVDDALLDRYSGW